GGARPAIGLENVAVEPEGLPGELLQINAGPERASDHALDLDGAAIESAAVDVALFPVERAVREHRILGAPPPARNILLAHPGWDALFETGGADDSRHPEAHQYRARRMRSDIRLKMNRPKLVLPAVIGTGKRFGLL